MGTIATVALWVVGILLACYLVLAEFLDTIGRLEIVEKRWPRVWRAMSNRPFRLILLLFLVVLLAKDVSDHLHEKKEPPALNVTIATIPVPVIQIVQTAQTDRYSGQKVGPTNRIHIDQSPCSVVQSGGNHNTASPQCGLPSRRLTDAQRTILRGFLQQETAKVLVWGSISDNDAMLLAGDLYKELKDDGWDMQGDKPEAGFATEGTAYDIHVFVAGEQRKAGEQVPINRATSNLLDGLRKIGLTVAFNTSPRVPEGITKLVINARAEKTSSMPQ